MSRAAFALPPAPREPFGRIALAWVELRGTWRAVRTLGTEGLLGEEVVHTEDPARGLGLRTRFSPEGDQLTRVEAPEDADLDALQALTRRHLGELRLHGAEARARLRLLQRLPLLLASVVLGIVAALNLAWLVLNDLHLLAAVVFRYLTDQPGIFWADVNFVLRAHAWPILSGLVFPPLSAWLTARLNRWLVRTLRRWLRERVRAELGL